MRRSEALRIFGFPENNVYPDEKELTRRYRKLAREKHPDKGGNPDEFLRIKQAYDILQGEEEADSNIRRAPTQMDEMFEQVFMGFNKKFSKFKGEEPKENIKKRVKLTVDELFHGAVREIEIEKTKPCDLCMGTGTGSKVQCSDCGGTGLMSFIKNSGRIVGMRTSECTTCKGRGGVGIGSDVPCSGCHGHKRLHYNVKKGIHIPKGTPHNGRINLIEGLDNPIEIIIQHPTNIDDGWKGWKLNADTRNLEITVPITLEEALIGKIMTIEHPGGGSVEISIESGTQPGTRIIKKDRGLPPCPDAKMPPSSAIIEIQVAIPKIPAEHHENIRRFFQIINRVST